MKNITIDAFFKKRDRKNLESSMPTSVEPSYSNVEASIPEYHPSKAPTIESKNIDISSLERDPGLHQQISKYPVNQQDEIRRAYIKVGLYLLLEYRLSNDKHPRRFQASWFKLFPN